jgi:outer membrane protein assembly factor BamA
VNRANEQDIGLTLSLYERRLEFNTTRFSTDNAVVAIRDPEGNLITALNPPYEMKSATLRHTLRIDLTDDYLDPRRGIRFNLAYQDLPPNTANDADYYRVDVGTTLYLPVRNSDTLALNYYRSDAHMLHPGNIDPTEIRQELNANCAPTDPACLSAEQALVDSTIAARTYGTATPLGGENRLRAYPRERFSGAHMAFAGAEYRWNFIRDAKPFDYFIWKDVTTSLQLAIFAEAGTVADTPSQLWSDYRTDYGIGGRLVSASGSVYRADVAYGKEGSQATIFFFYPWK